MSLPGEPLRIEKAVYGGDGLARNATGEVVFVPFALPGELVEAPAAAGQKGKFRVLEPSPARVEPRCVHFGTCGGCQYQMADYGAQLAMKAAILRETLERAGVGDGPELQVWGSRAIWGYRNRVRLRAREVEGALRLGYNRRGTKEFLPVTMCPISAPVLWACAEALMAAAASDGEARAWLSAAAEVEIGCDAEGTKAQVHLLCPGAVPRREGGLERLARQVAGAGVPLVAIGASRLHVASGRAMDELATAGAGGVAYRVGEDTFWLRPGSFFQVNRFLVPGMAALVCGERTGQLAWDLFAGVGLFARALARRFAAVTAVEASPAVLGELRRGLQGAGNQVVGATTLGFLRQAVLQRERPELVVLDPPRAGAGEEACGLLARLGPAEIVYVSCDPTTLGRDLAVLTAAAQYSVTELHMVDLFPHTYHLETVIALRRTGVGSYVG